MVAMRKGGGHQEALADVMAVELVGKNLLRLRLRRRNAFVLRELALVPILPASTPMSLGTDHKWVGSGPYRVTREGNDVVLTRDSKYWATPPTIAKVVFVRYLDSAQALREARQGRMDIVPELIREHYPEQLDVPFISQNFSVLRLAPADVSYLLFNASKRPFSDGNVRRAVAHSLDRQTLVDLAGGLTTSISGLIWPGGAGDGVAPAVPLFSSEEAGRLLDQAGWRDDDGDGIRSFEAQRLTVVVLKTEAAHQGRDAVIAGLVKAGFVVELRVAEANDLRERLRKGDFDLAFLTWRGPTDRDLSPILGSRGAKNYGGYQSPVVDELLASVRTTRKPEERRPLLTELARLLARSMPLVALHAPDPRGIVHKRVLGLIVSNGWFSIRDLRLETSE